MRRIVRLLLITLLASLILLSSHAQAQVNMWTFHNDNFRDGANTNETILTPSNVNTNTFAKLFSYTVDGFVYAQPLYIANVAITKKGTHNVVFVATENDSLYAFDADSNAGTNSTPLWQQSLLGSGESVLGTNDVGTTDITPNIGITGTPVIDVATRTLYVVSKSRLVSGGTTNYFQRLHALDITSGLERPNSPVLIQCSVSGTGEGSVGGVLAFNPLKESNRSSLLLLNGVVYIAFASHGDNSPYHGWVLGYNELTLQQVKVFITNPNSFKSGIWQAGFGPSADANGNIYFMTGNGFFDGATNNDYGDSILKLSTTNTGTNLVLVDYFTPYNQYTLGGTVGADTDLGSGGSILLPASVGGGGHTNLLVGAGKGRTIYLIDRDNMGHYSTNGVSDTNIVQSLISALAGVVLSGPAYFNNRVYYMSYNDYMKVYQITNGLLSTSPISTGTVKFLQWGITPTITANGTNNAIVWGVRQDAYNTPGPAVLYAFDAYNVATQFYNSSQAGTRDTAGNAVKFTLPTVVNGKVYVGTQTALNVYGNGIFTTFPIIVSQPQSQTVPTGTNATLSVGVLSSNSYATQWSFDGTNIPGATTTNYTITNVQMANAGNYSVVVSNSQGTATSSLAYLSVVAPLTNGPTAILAPPGMVDWWPADGNAIDIFGGNNGTPQNGFAYAPGISGLAFQFNGITNQMSVSAPNILPPWTACMWVNRQNAPGLAGILLADGNYSLKLEQYQNSTNSREVGITQLTGLDYVFSPAYIVPTNTWTHLAFVGNNTSVYLYVNGAFQGSVAYTNFPLPRTYIGAGFATSRYIDFMLGSLDEIMLFTNALTAPQISAIYGAGSSGLWRAPQFSSITQSNGLIPLGLKGQTGKTFTLYTSTNLSTWQQLITLSNPSGAVQYTNSISNKIQFYRATQP